MPIRTTGKPTQCQLSKANAPECSHTAADCRKHAAHLSITPLMDDCLDYRTPLLCLQHAQTCRSRPAVLQENAGAQLRQTILRNGAHNLRMIGLVDLVARMEQPLCQRTVVGDEEQSLRIGIQSPHGVKPHREIGQKIEHGLAAPIIPHRRKLATRLIEENVTALFIFPYEFAVDGDFMPRRIVL